jgi:hypothetical protein
MDTSTLQLPARSERNKSDNNSDSDGVMVSAPASPDSANMYVHDSDGDDAQKQIDEIKQVEQLQPKTPDRIATPRPKDTGHAINKDTVSEEHKYDITNHTYDHNGGQIEMSELKVPEKKTDPEIASPSIMPDSGYISPLPAYVYNMQPVYEEPPLKYKKIKAIALRVAKVLCCPCVCVGITGLKSYKNVKIGYDESVKWAKS